MKKAKGFTIVELLVVIVVIGILAAIVIVSFGNVQRRARVASIQSDLKNSANTIAMYYVENSDTYPADIGVANLKPSSDTIFSYATLDNGYCLGAVSAYDDTVSYHISSESGGVVEDGKCVMTWLQVSVGGSHSCAIASDNKAYCWGANSYGQLGDNTTEDKLVPTSVNTAQGVSALYGKTVKSISAGAHHTCVIASDDTVYCWGYNAYGQLGDNTTENKLVPTAVNTANGVSALWNKTVKFISGGYFGTCVVASDDLAYCSGRNDYGQIGNNSTSQQNAPVAVYSSGSLNNKTIKIISPGNLHTCALASDSKVYCWGHGEYGQIGNNTTTVTNVIPLAVNTTNGVSALYNKTVKSISSGVGHNCVIASDDLAYCWGNGATFGANGDNASAHRLVPVAVNTESGVSALYNKTVKFLSSGANRSCVIASDNLAYCWGRNNFGSIGDNTTSHRFVPVAVNTSSGLSALYGKQVKAIDTSLGDHTCAISLDGQLYCWGYNSNGQLGNNSETTSHVPFATEQLDY